MSVSTERPTMSHLGRGYDKLSEELWTKAETMAAFQCTFGEIAQALSLNYHKFEKAIKKKYHLTRQEWIEKYSLSGRAKFRANLFAMANDGKHPIVSIFCAKNWLGMMDEKSVKKPPEIDDKSQRALTAISNILTKIADKSSMSTNNMLKLEKENQKIEETIFTEVEQESIEQSGLNTIDPNDNEQSNTDNDINNDNHYHLGNKQDAGHRVGMFVAVRATR